MTFLFFWFTWEDNVSRETSKMKDLKHILTARDHLVTGKKFDILKNLDTGILETHPRPSKDELALYYESKNYASHNANNKPSSFLSFCYKQVKVISTKRKIKICINSLSAPQKNKKPTLLDFGCGTGDFLYSCHKHGWIVKGIENNSNARNSLNPEISKYVVDDFSLLKTKSEKFDIITMWHSLEHISDLDQTILEMKSLLSVKGVIIIACPNHKSFDAVFYKEFWAAYDLPRHLWHFDKNTISELFSKYKIKLTKTLPMYWDSFYISILSEKIANKKNNYFKGFVIGLMSNLSALFSKEYSSLVYILKTKT
jgi:2-polyprenyl-3-methyl-5-hydroxy-6-metoxy-1,4-benzoquinol methylase